MSKVKRTLARLATVAAAFVIAALAFTGAGVPAHAADGNWSVGGGGLPGSGSTGGNAPAGPNYQIRGVYEPDGAWKEFFAMAKGANGVSNGHQSETAMISYLNGVSSGLGNQCVKSRLIIYLHATGSRDAGWPDFGFLRRTPSDSDLGPNTRTFAEIISKWNSPNNVFYWNGAMTQSSLRTNSIPNFNRAVVWPTGVPQSARNAVVDFAYTNASKTTLKQNLTIICALFEPYDQTTENRYIKMTESLSEEGSFTAPYSYSTSVTREIERTLANGVVGDPIGANNMNHQPTVTVKTNFGELYDSILNSEVPSNLSAQVAAALALDANIDHPDVNLNAGNQAGLSEGGVLNVSEHTQLATISFTQNEVWEKCFERKVEYTFNNTTKKWGNPVNVDTPLNCSANHPWVDTARDSGPTNPNKTWFETNNWVNVSDNSTTDHSLGTLQEVGFWQILSVHCNLVELNQLLNAITGEQIVSQVAGVTGDTTTVLYSRRYTTRQDAQNAGQILGVDSSTLPAAIARTGQIGFYDKECVIDICTDSSNTSQGATIQNGGVTNVGSNSNITGRNYLDGAMLNGVNSNYFEIFRDNEFRTITVNTWFPQSGGQLKYDGHAPVSTTITRWSEGTPTTAENSGGKFSAEAVNPAGIATPIFTGVNANIPARTNYGINTHNTLDSTTLPGLYRTLNVKASWASEVDKPQVINISWEYRPTVTTRIPTRVGFGGTNGGNIEIGSYTTHEQEIDVRCFAEYGTDTTTTTNTEQTGSGTVDSGFNSYVDGDRSYTRTPNLVIKFLRAVSE